MRLPLLAVTVAALALAAAGCQSSHHDAAPAKSKSPTPSASPAAAAPSVALVRADQVQVSEGSKPLRSITAVTTGATVGQLSWSGDGKQLAWMESPSDGSATSIVLADVATGATHRWACNCLRIAFRGSDLVSDGATSPQQLLVYPAAGGTPSTWAISGLPAADPTTAFLQPLIDIVAGSPDGVFIGYAPGNQSSTGGPQTVYRVDADGRATALYADPANGIPIQGVLAPKASQLAYVVNNHASACENVNTVTLIDLATGKASSPTLPQANSTALSAWFDASGQLYATLAQGPKNCSTGKASAVTKTDPVVYKALGGKWVATPLKGTRGAALDGNTALIQGSITVNGQQLQPTPPGPLVVETATGQQTKQLADQVVTFAISPQK